MGVNKKESIFFCRIIKISVDDVVNLDDKIAGI